MYKLVYQPSSEGISKRITFFKSRLPLQIKCKPLWYTKKWNAGRGNDGWRILRTRGKHKSKVRLQTINYSYRFTSMFIITSFIFNHQVHKLISVVFLSSGAITHLVTTTRHQLFYLNHFYSTNTSNTSLITHMQNVKPLLKFLGLVMYLPKNKPISLIELLPYKGVQYTRSTGSFGILLKMDLRVNTALIKLPSGVRKVFSTHSLGSAGSVALPQNKNFKNNLAGFRKKKGFKSVVRGVAMNPVDHPHGGRAKAIKYQRTPWGKTTKFK